MALNKLERLIVSAQMIKVHDGDLKVHETDLIDSIEICKHNDHTHIEYSIALVEVRNIKEIYVIFPGSNDGDDWVTNFQFRLHKMIYKVAKAIDPVYECKNDELPHETIQDIGMVIPHADKKGCEDWSDQRVHSGFMRAYHRIEDQAMLDLKEVLEQNPRARIYGTGHSLGSAMLRFMMLDAQVKNLFENRKAPEIYTFGAPRMGNKKFCKALNKYLPKITRVVHNNDLVSRLPLPLMGYSHEVKEHFIGIKKFIRLYYKQDIDDHFLEGYINQLDHLRTFVAQDIQNPFGDLEQGSATLT